jgi:hypothetical protein
VDYNCVLVISDTRQRILSWKNASCKVECTILWKLGFWILKCLLAYSCVEYVKGVD